MLSIECQDKKLIKGNPFLFFFVRNISLAAFIFQYFHGRFIVIIIPGSK